MSRKIGFRAGTCDAANNNYHDENYHVGCYEDHGYGCYEDHDYGCCEDHYYDYYEDHDYGCYDDNDDEKGHDGLLGLMMS